MKNTKIWIFIIAIIFLLSVVASFIIFKAPSKGTIANIYENGVCIKSIDLSKISKEYTFTIKTDNGINVIAAQKNKISIVEADCSDHICINQGWVSNSATPIVCLPHKIVIKLENTAKNTETEFDTLSQ